MFDWMSILKEILFFAGYLSKRSSFPQPLPPEEEKAWLAKTAEGDEEAKRTLVEHNLRLVAHIAHKYDTPHQSEEDLVSIGTIGLIKAVNTFKPGRGTQLATYAARCIENEILMTLRSNKKQRHEVYIQDPIGTDKEGNDISLLEILGSEPDKVEELAFAAIESDKLRLVMRQALTKREQQVLQMRFGLVGRPLPQREVGKILGISRSYVSRIEKKALEKLKRKLEELQS